MYFPGQPLYLPEEKTIGIFLGAEERSNYRHLSSPVYTVAIMKDGGKDVSVEVVEANEMSVLLEASTETLTGQKIYYGPKNNDTDKYLFRRPLWSSVITDEDLEKEKFLYIKLLKTLLKTKWVMENYDLKQQSTAKNDKAA